MHKTKYLSAIAKVVATQGTCIRRQVGCVLINTLGHIIATGYNGPPRGFEHCTDSSCSGAGLPSGEGLDKCQAVHAEQNALLQCTNTESIHAAFVTTTPCIHCIKLLLNTSCQFIYFTELYPHAEEALKMWELAGRTWEQLPIK